MKKAIFLGIVIAMVPVVGFCKGPSGPNPAAALCKDVKGVSEPFYQKNGSEGAVCALGRGIIEEWTLFNQLSAGRRVKAIEKFLNWQQPKPIEGELIGHPAKIFCEQQMGGISVNVKDAQGGEFGLCQFDDQSAIEEWTLWRGPSDELNKELVHSLVFQSHQR